MTLGDNALLALETIAMRPTRGIPTFCMNPMSHAHLERLAGAEPGAYQADPVPVYLAAQHGLGVCMIDQWIPDNPLTMGDRGYEGGTHGATTGAEVVELDGRRIDGPEAVVAHLEQVAFPRLVAAAAEFDEATHYRHIVAGEAAVQGLFGPDILKVPYAVASFPGLAYFSYGYAPYLTAYALYPEVMERHFALQAELALRINRAAARAYREADLPRLLRADHDMADSRGTLVSVESLDRLWFPHFARCMAPLFDAGVRVIWHCDGNLTAMVPRLLEVGLKGFQGFQYEDGMDYEQICRQRAADGDALTIIAGVSVTRTLPFGTPADVRDQLRWLVEHGPRVGLFLGCSSSICPGVPWANMAALTDGLAWYRAHGR